MYTNFYLVNTLCSKSIRLRYPYYNTHRVANVYRHTQETDNISDRDNIKTRDPKLSVKTTPNDSKNRLKRPHRRMSL